MIGRWLSRFWRWLTEGPQPRRSPYPKGDPPSDRGNGLRWEDRDD